MKLRRTIEQYQGCEPSAMAADMSQGAQRFAFEDMRRDILTLHAENTALKKLLCIAGYPRLGTQEEGMTMQQFAEKVQAVISHAEAVNL